MNLGPRTSQHGIRASLPTEAALCSVEAETNPDLGEANAFGPDSIQGLSRPFQRFLRISQSSTVAQVVVLKMLDYLSSQKK